MSTVTERTTTMEEIDTFGGCPMCHNLDGVLNTRDSAWGVCHRHRTAWFVEGRRYKGDLPPYQLEANRALVDEFYARVEPFRPPRNGGHRDRPRVAVRFSNTSCRETCVLCGGDHRVPVGLAAVLAGEDTWSPVCNGCALEFAPGLFPLLDAYTSENASGPLARALRNAREIDERTAARLAREELHSLLAEQQRFGGAQKRTPTIQRPWDDQDPPF